MGIYQMKVPISKQLIDNITLPCISITGVAIFDLYTTGQKRFDQNILFIILFGTPALLFTWFLLNKKVKFRDDKKVRKNKMLFRLPFSSFSTLFIFIISSFFLVAGIAIIVSDKNVYRGLPILSFGLLLFILTAICVENRRIWFSDTFSIEDTKNTSEQSFPAYQDGVFSYQGDSFTIQLNPIAKTINWGDITQIKAYKIDQFAVDSIVIEIHLTENCISIDDETGGYMKFMQMASSKLKNFKNDWFFLVAFPAFKTNLTIIYER